MPIVLRAAADAAGSPLDHYWSRVVGAGRANEGLRADWQRPLAAVRATCGFEYVRFHGLVDAADLARYVDTDLTRCAVLTASSTAAGSAAGRAGDRGRWDSLDHRRRRHPGVHRPVYAFPVTGDSALTATFAPD
jgi:hypothetical protein